MPDQQCPVPMDKLEDYRRTIAHKHDGTTEDFVEQLHSLDHSKQKRKLNTAWKGETWFRVKPNIRPPKPPIASQNTTSRAQTASNQQQQSQALQKRRYTEKKPERPEEMAANKEQQPSSAQQSPSATGIPRPKEVPATEDHWIREGHLWKRVHNQTQNRTLHTATNTRWTRCDKTEPRENNNGQTNIGSKMVQN